MNSDITILRSRGPLLAKRITPDGITDYDDAKHFDVSSVTVSSIDDISRLLLRLSVDPRCCVIRGELINPNHCRGVRRLLHGGGATFRDAPRRWLALDIEGIERPARVSPTDLASCAALAFARLPGAFRQARCTVQASAGHGIKPDVRLRLWFWLSRPASGDELARWIGDAVDPASFRAVQIIYTAAPVLQGVPDPLPRRLTRLPGNPAVAVPTPEALAPAPRPPVAERHHRQGDRYIDAALVGAARQVANAGDGTRHLTLLREGASLLRFVSDGRLDLRDLVDVLAAAAHHAGLDQGEIDNAIEWLTAREGAA